MNILSDMYRPLYNIDKVGVGSEWGSEWGWAATSPRSDRKVAAWGNVYDIYAISGQTCLMFLDKNAAPPQPEVVQYVCMPVVLGLSRNIQIQLYKLRNTFNTENKILMLLRPMLKEAEI